MSDTATAAPAPGKTPTNTKRNIVIGMIIILLVMLLSLFYYYISMLQPKINVQKPKLKDYEWVRSIYGISNSDKLDRPHDVAADKAGNIYIADSGKARIIKLDNNGNYVTTIGKKQDLKRLKGSRTGEYLLNPVGVAVSDEGDVYVADRNLHKIVVYGSNGQYKKDWLVMMPVKPIVIKDKVYVTTYGPLYVFDKNGKELAKWGRRGKKSTEFDFPNGLVADMNAENIIVADTNNNQIKNFTATGQLKWIEGRRRKGFQDNELKYQLLTGLTFDDSGLLYSVDAFSFIVRVFAIEKDKLKLIQAFGRSGSGDGELMYPGGIAYLGDRRFAIADEGNGRVQIIRIPLSQKMAKAAENLPDNFKSDIKGATGVSAFFSNLLDTILRLLGLR